MALMVGAWGGGVGGGFDLLGHQTWFEAVTEQSRDTAST